jgi:hypothetical protein
MGLPFPDKPVQLPTQASTPMERRSSCRHGLWVQDAKGGCMLGPVPAQAAPVAKLAPAASQAPHIGADALRKVAPPAPVGAKTRLVDVKGKTHQVR